MAENGNGNGKINENSASHKDTDGRVLRDFMKDLRIAQDAVAKAQEENRRLGIPNWYSIDGKIVSDIQLAEMEKAKQK